MGQLWSPEQDNLARTLAIQEQLEPLVAKNAARRIIKECHRKGIFLSNPDPNIWSCTKFEAGFIKIVTVNNFGERREFRLPFPMANDTVDEFCDRRNYDGTFSPKPYLVFLDRVLTRLTGRHKPRLFRVIHDLIEVTIGDILEHYYKFVRPNCNPWAGYFWLVKELVAVGARALWNAMKFIGVTIFEMLQKFPELTTTILFVLMRILGWI